MIGTVIGTVIGAVIGAVVSAALGAAAASAVAGEPTMTLRNGVLAGWEVTTDNEVLLCSDPIVFIRAKQIECP